METLDFFITWLKIESDRRRTRFSITMLGLALFSLAAFASFIVQDSDPNWGMTVERSDNGLVIVWMQPSGMAWDAGVRPGDIVIARDSQPVGESGTTTTQGLHTLSVLKAQTGQILDLVARPQVEFGLAISLLMAAILWLIVATCVLLWAPLVEQAIAFYAFSLDGALLLTVGVGEPSGALWIVRSLYVFTVLFFCCLACFFLVFPKNRLSARASRAYSSLFAPPAVLIALYLLSSFRWQSLYEVVRPAANLSLMVFAFVSVGAFGWGFVESRKENAESQLWIPIVGTAVAAMGIILTIAVPMALGWAPLILPQLSALLAVLIPISFAYAILRHRLLGLSNIIRRAMINFFVVVALFVALLVLTIGVDRIVDPTSSTNILDIALELLFVAVAVVTLPALHRGIQQFVDRVFFRQVYAYDQALGSVTRILASARSADELASEVVATLANALGLSYATVVLGDVGGRPQIIASTDPTRKDMAEAAVAAAEAMRNGNDVFANAVDKVEMTSLPLISGGAKVGMLCLGPKVSGLSLAQRDMNLLASMTTQLAMGLDNARLLRTVQRNLAEIKESAARLQEGQRMLRELNHRLLMAEEKERRRLAADLHDDPLQRIMLLQRQVDSCRSGRCVDSDQCQNMAGEAAAALRRICVDCHPPLLEDLGLEAALDWLVENASKSSQIPIRMETDQSFGEIKLRPEAQISLYRVAQEALNNAVRHSHASSVLVRLSMAECTVFVSVRDDGIGFQMPESTTQLSMDGHLGLIGMRERMEFAGGQLHVYTAPGTGTEVLAILSFGTKRGNKGGKRPDHLAAAGVTSER